MMTGVGTTAPLPPIEPEVFEGPGVVVSALNVPGKMICDLVNPKGPGGTCMGEYGSYVISALVYGAVIMLLFKVGRR
jgi:hypothetical protein